MAIAVDLLLTRSANEQKLLAALGREDPTHEVVKAAAAAGAGFFSAVGVGCDTPSDKESRDGGRKSAPRDVGPAPWTFSQRVPRAQMIERPSQLDAFLKRATGVVGEDPLAPRRGQRVVLQRRVLLERRNAGVADKRHRPHRLKTLGRTASRDTPITDTGCERSYARRPQRPARCRDNGRM